MIVVERVKVLLEFEVEGDTGVDSDDWVAVVHLLTVLSGTRNSTVVRCAFST
jgi:hypothetical protein